MSSLILLSSEATARYLNLEFDLRELKSEFAVGLDAATRAIYKAGHEISLAADVQKAIKQYTRNFLSLGGLSVSSRNAALASLVREVASEHGWLEGWKCLSVACPHTGMHKILLDDVAIGVDVYTHVRPSTKPRPHIDIHFTVRGAPAVGNISEIGPKSIGGHNWESDPAYKRAVRDWQSPTDLPMGPCPFFAWIGVAKKVEEFKDSESAGDFWTSQLLGIVDYDFDKDDKRMKGGIRHAVERTAEMATKTLGGMRGAGWIGLLTMDQQLFNRKIQMRWVQEKKGSFLVGPSHISPRDFAIAGYIDCAALAPFAYQDESSMPQSRKAMFIAVLFANMHDLLFDMGCSSRISEAAYADATGVFKYDLPEAFVVGMIDELAKETLNAGLDDHPTYGANALFVTCIWDIFNVRYRAWERLVKYTRLLQQSKSEIAANILKRAKDGLIMVPENMDTDIGESWETALSPNNASKLVTRSSCTTKYSLNTDAQLLEDNGLAPPDLCSKCTGSFQSAFVKGQDEVEAISGLPSSVTDCIPVHLAAAIRRAAIWATTSECCDNCGCVVGLWGNQMSDRVVVAIMQTELKASSRDWLLQNYFVGCVAFSPLRLISILTGFDLTADIEYEAGAMGERDVVDC